MINQNLKDYKKILVTGVGGGVGQSILKALEHSVFEVIAVDSSEKAAGLFSNRKSYLGFDAKHDDFVSRLLQICIDENVGVVFPGHDIELKYFSQSKSIFENHGITIAISDLRVISICNDKFKTYEFLLQNGFDVPKTFNYKDFLWKAGSYVLKPRIDGARSRSTYIIHSFEDYQIYSQLIDPDNCVVQEYIDGDEYTCGSVTLHEKCLGVIAMRRELRSGDTYKAYVEDNKMIKEHVKNVIDTLKPFGACNVQLKFSKGKIYVFEINARCSGTTAARAIAGFNEPLAIASKILQNKDIPLSDNEMSIFRYWNEIAVGNEIVQELRKNGKVDSKGKSL